MEEVSVGTFANRDEPIPVFKLPGTEDSSLGLSSDDESSKESQKSDGLEHKGHDGADNVGSSKSHKRKHSLQDRLFAKFVTSLLP
jgi:hypothetical protein